MTAMGFPTSPSDGDKYEKWVFQASTSSWVIDEASLSLSASTTDDLVEGSTNFYYTNDRFDDDLDSAISAGKITASSSLQNTDSLGEGSTNLYFTDARADARVTAAILDEDNMVSDDATKAPSQQSVKAYVDASTTGLTTSNIDPAALVTESEGISGTDDDTHIPTTAAVKDYADAAAAALQLTNTDSLSEGSTNFYYTNDRFDADLDSALAAGKIKSVDSDKIVSIVDSYVDSDFVSLHQKYMTINSTAPSGPKNGEMWLDVDSDVVRVWDGDFWFDFPAPVPNRSLVRSFVDSFYVSTIVDSDYIRHRQDRLSIRTSAPASPLTGQLWLKSDSDVVLFYDGDVWAELPTSQIALGGGSVDHSTLRWKSSTNSWEETLNLIVTDSGVGVGVTTPTEKLHVDGNILASGDVTAFSDQRLKTEVQPLDGSKVYDMRGVSYIKEGERGSGVIAQELQRVAPELVHEGEYLSVAYGNLTGYLIEAVKELKQEQTRLNTVIEELLENN